MRQDEIDKLDKFINQFKYLSQELEHCIGYLKLTPEGEMLKDRAMEILGKKLKKIDKAKSFEDLKEQLRIKRIIGRGKTDDGDDDE